MGKPIGRRGAVRGAGALALCFAWLGGPGRSLAAPETFELSGPPECADAATFRARLAALPVVSKHPTEMRGLAIRVVQAGGAYSGELQLALADGLTVVRRVAAPRCEEVIDALEFVTALVLGLDFFPPSPPAPVPPPMPAPIPARDPSPPAREHAPEPPAPSPGVAPRAPVSPAAATQLPGPPPARANEEAAPAERGGWRFVGGAQVGLAGGVGPSLDVAPMVSLGAVLDSASAVAPELDVSAMWATSGDQTAGTSAASLTLWSGALLGCPLRVSLGHGVAARPCVEVQAGALLGSAAGTSAPLAGPTTTREPWVALAGLGRLEWRASSRWVLHATGGVEAPIFHDSLFFESSSSGRAYVYTVPSAAGTLRLGVSVLGP